MTDLSAALILIVDDDTVGRMTLERLLQTEGYRVETAVNGLEGLDKAKKLQPDLILLDVIMPEMNGFEVCRELRKDSVLSDVPVLMLTALEDEESRLEGIKAGADDFISKPYQPTVLRAKVKTVTGLNRFRRIRSERARFGWVVENADEGYLMVNQAGKLLYANSKARVFLGFTENSINCDVLEALQGQFTLQPPEAWDNWPELPEDGNLQLLRPESAVAPAVWLAVRAQSHVLGQDREVLLQLRDITSEVASRRSVWSFESLIGHKLRTPMTKITWGLSFITRKAHKLDVEKIVEFAEMSSQGVKELQRELEEVMSYINAPSAVPDGNGFCLAGLETMINEIASRLELKPVHAVAQPGLPSNIHLTHRAFEMVLWELLQNSKKFHPEHLPSVELRMKAKDDMVTIELEDDGSSLSPEQLRKAFLPYYQGEKNFTGQVPGMGLGLPMVASLLMEVGGSCVLRNREGAQGIVVELSVPAGRG